MRWGSRVVVAAWIAACNEEATEPQRTPNMLVDAIAEDDTEATQPSHVDVDSPTDVYVNAPDRCSRAGSMTSNVCVSGGGVSAEIWAHGDHFPVGALDMPARCDGGTNCLLLGAGKLLFRQA